VFCRNISYINPLPVTVAIVPVVLWARTAFRGKPGVLVVRRGEEPGKGLLALPGGYMDVGELWQEGLVRELREETGVASDAGCVTLLTVETSLRHSSILMFGRIPMIHPEALNEFKPSHEVSELVVLTEPQELAFPTHTDVLRRHFAGDFDHLK